jgi:hypothetical protein
VEELKKFVEELKKFVLKQFSPILKVKFIFNLSFSKIADLQLIAIDSRVFYFVISTGGIWSELKFSKF